MLALQGLVSGLPSYLKKQKQEKVIIITGALAGKTKRKSSYL